MDLDKGGNPFEFVYTYFGPTLGWVRSQLIPTVVPPTQPTIPSGTTGPGGTSGQIEFNNAGAFGGFTMGGDATVNTSSGALTIANGAVTYGKMQPVSASLRLLGRISAGGGIVEELTGTQATTLLDQFTATLKGVTPPSGGGTANFLRADGTWTTPPGGGGGGRPIVAGNVTYYVRVDGSDSNNGLTNAPGGAFLTMQKAINVLNTLDGGGFAATIQCGPGTYTAQAVAATPFIGFSSVTLQGDTTTPSNVIISVDPSSQNCIVADNNTVLNVQGFKLVASGTATGVTGCGIFTQNRAVVNIIGPMEYGQCALAHMFAYTNSTINVLASYTISGNATFHMGAVAATISNKGTVLTVTFAVTMTFVGSFIYCDRLGLIIGFNITFTGGVIVNGTRFNCGFNSVIFTNGGGINFFPGSIAGATVAGGQYG